MLPERLATELNYFGELLCQPINRWEGFELSAPHSRTHGLREQIFYASWLMALLAKHPAVEADERSYALKALVTGINRLIQRRIWAPWANTIEQLGQVPDPIDRGHASYSGSLGTLLGLAASLGEHPYVADPVVLRWSHEFVFNYNHVQMLQSLSANMHKDESGAIVDQDETTSSSAMALVLWGLRLSPIMLEPDQQSASERWLKTLRNKLMLRGPRLPGRGLFAHSYHVRRRRASLRSDALEDAMTLALLAPVVPELAQELAPRHWPSVAQPERVTSTLVLAFSALAALALQEEERATQLSTAATARPDSDTPLPRALLGLGACGGLMPSL
ncbi:hypothetical protein [Candidatus Viridilinea mediisalina]|uniref:Uncharacterized protein n=1 Tax=Candidatus Viridilinea mediisalina TaxID=2024553 RepID=A0A2A6RDI5_9CHLR|nr:hypothetical protein [Candidatus Viridilinea mediisalina]PDV99621.1 hypothetical protein CJ255_21425 [Candidatus Viridilinea mediisalina]